jgi:hypothetical protein
VVDEDAERPAVDVVGRRRAVLVQRAAGGDVHDLHPAADAQQRDVALERPAGQRELEGVALSLGASVVGRRLAP